MVAGILNLDTETIALAAMPKLENGCHKAEIAADYGLEFRLGWQTMIAPLSEASTKTIAFEAVFWIVYRNCAALTGYASITRRISKGIASLGAKCQEKSGANPVQHRFTICRSFPGY